MTILFAKFLQNLQKYSLVIILVVIAALGSYFYVKNLNNKVSNLTTQNNVLKTNNVKKDITINQFKNDVEEIKEINSNLINEINDQNIIIKDLQNKFNIQANGQSRDLGSITRIKPKLIENIVNNATKNVNRCFEIATGSEIKEGEKNNECKELLQKNYKF